MRSQPVRLTFGLYKVLAMRPVAGVTFEDARKC